MPPSCRSMGNLPFGRSGTTRRCATYRRARRKGEGRRSGRTVNRTVERSRSVEGPPPPRRGEPAASTVQPTLPGSGCARYLFGETKSERIEPACPPEPSSRNLPSSPTRPSTTPPAPPRVRSGASLPRPAASGPRAGPASVTPTRPTAAASRSSRSCSRTSVSSTAPIASTDRRRMSSAPVSQPKKSSS